jgi:hypothetical protein
VQAGFADKQSIAPDEPIELTIDRPLATGEGRLAVLIGATDMSDLFVVSARGLKYDAGKSFPLPLGATELTVYLVQPNDEWKELARFPLRVGENAEAKPENAEAIPAPPEAKTESQPASGESAQQGTAPGQQPQPQARRRFGFDKMEFAPQFNIGFKSQFAETHFPEANEPGRPTFADATAQGIWKVDMARGAFNMQQQFDFVGSSFRNEALRFGDLQGRAPKVDLSSYSMQFQQGTSKFTVGHASFGDQRHLINNFSSRGLTLGTSLGPHIDISIMAMNGANVVGFDNFSGLDNRRHRAFSAILGLEAFKSRPGGLRFEVAALDAWFTSNRQNFTQSNVNDAERSRGYSARLQAKDKSARARLDAGFTRSYFYNPDDPLLNQGAAVQPSRAETRDARYVDVGYDLLKDFVFKRAATPAATTGSDGAQAATPSQDSARPAAESKKLNLTVNFHHERVDPLFKSIGASTQADMLRDEADFAGSFGELNITAAQSESNDNLAGIRTILRTDTRRTAFAINTPLQGLFGGSPPLRPNPFLPRIGYTFERVRAFPDFIPIGGGFDQPGAIPNQANIAQSFVAEWQIKMIRLGYHLNYSLQDNRAAGRENADLRNFAHNATVGWNPLTTLELNLELNFEDARNRELARTDRTLRFGGSVNWQTSKRQTFNLTLSTTGAGDLARTAKNFDGEFDLQWAYRLTRGNENRFKKFQANYFIRYANRYARTRDFAGNIDNLTKLQTFNTGLNFIFF